MQTTGTSTAQLGEAPGGTPCYELYSVVEIALTVTIVLGRGGGSQPWVGDPSIAAMSRDRFDGKELW